MEGKGEAENGKFLGGKKKIKKIPLEAFVKSI